jgi:pantoate--beta-alanine ligase
MGALHEGHASLIRLARERAGYVVVSIFVNPKQFGPKEDFGRYPRDLDLDSRTLEELGCDLLFAPAGGDIYSRHDRTRVSVEGISETLCGRSRQGHFNGVTLIVAKLFNIVMPDFAVFGQKDAQQAVIIQRMVADLDFPVRIIIGPTLREPDGLAMSSRNSYLGENDRVRARAIYRALELAKERIEGGDRAAVEIGGLMRKVMEDAGCDVEYAAVVDGETLEPVEVIKRTVLLAAAARLGDTRLIDNIALKVEGRKVSETVLEFPEWSRYG